jgi:lipopolysaccharide transport system ATP-binding protein
MTTAILIENISKRYRLGETHEHTLSDQIARMARRISGRDPVVRSEPEDFWALRGVDLEITEGEAVGIIGGNGAGKSTLLKILSRITQPTTGRMMVRGRMSSLLEVGTGFHPELTGRDNVFLNGTILGMRKSEVARKFDEIVAFSGVEKFIDTPVKRYSSGMYVRLAFAVAAHLEPDILVVDEVLAVGDTEFQQRCLGKMGEVASEGRTVLFVSHNLSAIRKLCSSGVLLSGGIVKYSGRIDETLSTYLSLALRRHGENVLSLHRPGWATPCIASVALSDKSGKLVKELPQGADLTFAMSFTATKSCPINKPVMGITIKNALGDTVGGINSRMTATAFKAASIGMNGFQCVLLAPPLLQGKYLVDFWLGDGQENIDVLENVLEFSIVESDIYNSGVPPFDHMGSIYFMPRWSMTGE